MSEIDVKGVLLVKRVDPGKEGNLDELEELANSAGYVVLDKVMQSRAPDKAYAWAGARPRR